MKTFAEGVKACIAELRDDPKCTCIRVAERLERLLAEAEAAEPTRTEDERHADAMHRMPSYMPEPTPAKPVEQAVCSLECGWAIAGGEGQLYFCSHECRVLGRPANKRTP